MTRPATAEQRYYSSTQGRFLSPDPYVANAATANPQSWNRYAYVEGDPVNLFDPRGLEASSPGFYWYFPPPPPYWLPGSKGEDHSMPIMESGDETPNYSEAEMWDISRHPQVDSKWFATQALQWKIANLGPGCRSVLPKAQTLASRTTEVKWWDARPSEDGLATIGLVLNNPADKNAGTYLKDLPGEYAEVVQTGAGSITKNVVLKVGFFKADPGLQMTVLLHEYLHFYFGLPERDLAERLGIPASFLESYRPYKGSPSIDYSPAIIDWLLSDCGRNRK